MQLCSAVDGAPSSYAALTAVDSRPDFQNDSGLASETTSGSVGFAKLGPDLQNGRGYCYDAANIGDRVRNISSNAEKNNPNTNPNPNIYTATYV